MQCAIRNVHCLHYLAATNIHTNLYEHTHASASCYNFDSERSRERAKKLQLLAAQHTLTTTLALTLCRFGNAVKMHSVTVVPAAPIHTHTLPSRSHRTITLLLLLLINTLPFNQGDEIIAKILFFSFKPILVMSSLNLANDNRHYVWLIWNKRAKNFKTLECSIFVSFLCFLSRFVTNPCLSSNVRQSPTLFMWNAIAFSHFLLEKFALKQL